MPNKQQLPNKALKSYTATIGDPLDKTIHSRQWNVQNIQL